MRSAKAKPSSQPLATKVIALTLILMSQSAEARNLKELAQGAAIGAGIAVLVDGAGGVLTGATAGLLVASIGRRGNSDRRN